MLPWCRREIESQFANTGGGMSYPFAWYLENVRKGLFDEESADLRLRWVMEGSSLAGSGEPGIASLDAATNLNECNWSGYAEKTVANLTLVVPSSFYSGWTVDPIVYTGLVPATAVVGGVFHVAGASMALRYPVWYFDTPPLFPIRDRTGVIIVAGSGGVRLGT